MAATIEATTQMSKMSVQDVQIKKLNDAQGDEEVEEILRDNTRRFCLFPIKYHEVSFFLYYSITVSHTHTNLLTSLSFLYKKRSGNSTRRLKHLSGLLKKSIYPRTNMIGKPR